MPRCEITAPNSTNYTLRGDRETVTGKGGVRLSWPANPATRRYCYGSNPILQRSRYDRLLPLGNDRNLRVEAEGILCARLSTLRPNIACPTLPTWFGCGRIRRTVRGARRPNQYKVVRLCALAHSKISSHSSWRKAGTRRVRRTQSSRPHYRFMQRVSDAWARFGHIQMLGGRFTTMRPCP